MFILIDLGWIFLKNTFIQTTRASQKRTAERFLLWIFTPLPKYHWHLSWVIILKQSIIFNLSIPAAIHTVLQVRNDISRGYQHSEIQRLQDAGEEFRKYDDELSLHVCERLDSWFAGQMSVLRESLLEKCVFLFKGFFKRVLISKTQPREWIPFLQFSREATIGPSSLSVSPTTSTSQQLKACSVWSRPIESLLDELYL